MPHTDIATGVVHEVPADIEQALLENQDVLTLWNGLTPQARNEWICWVTIVKKQETREKHLIRLCEDIRDGKKRPCCRPGCPHRNEKAKKYFK
jgi:uncharacterized protein YdeI (YjbR/CyaY-like superfamily)